MKKLYMFLMISRLKDVQNLQKNAENNTKKYIVDCCSTVVFEITFKKLQETQVFLCFYI